MPSIDGRGGHHWAESTVLALGTFLTRSIDPTMFSARIESLHCLDGVCISPGGEAAIGMAAVPNSSEVLACQVVRWRWDGPREPNTPPVTEHIQLSSDCVPAEDPHLVAALAPDLVVLDDDRHLHLTDLHTGAWVSTPKLGTNPPDMFPADRGRAMIFVANNGAVSRADSTGIRIVSAEHTPCSQPTGDDTVVSPSGNWVVQTCLDDVGVIGDFTPVSEFGSIVRISASGIERFDGIPMRTLAVDDDGNALLYSYDRDDNDREPRGLFVLDASGEVVRVDDLEPTPRPLVGGYISAQPGGFGVGSGRYPVADCLGAAALMRLVGGGSCGAPP
jgi:hypothetical protein